LGETFSIADSITEEHLSYEQNENELWHWHHDLTCFGC